MNTVNTYTIIHLRVKLDRYVGSCNTFNDVSNEVCILNKTEDLNIHVFNTITRKN